MDNTEPKKEIATTNDSVPASATINDDAQITLRVVGQDGSEILFRIKTKTPISRLMDAYCQRMAVSRNAIRFLFDGKRVNPEDTPVLLKMEDKDIIDAVLQQVGGDFK